MTQANRRTRPGTHSSDLSGAGWVSPHTLTITPDRRQRVQFDPAFPLVLSPQSWSPLDSLVPNYHEFLEIACFVEGRGEFAVGDRRYAVSRGDIVVINDTTFHTLQPRSGAALKVAVVYFRPEVVYQPGSGGVAFDYLVPFHDRGPGFVHRIPAASGIGGEVLALMARMQEELRAQRPYYRLAVRNCLCEILLLLDRHYVRSRAGGGGQAERLRQIERLTPLFTLVHEHYHRKILTSELARAACMSPNYLCRFFRRITGATMSAYIMRYRVDKAKELLADRRRTITQVALETGFESHSYFDRVFRELTHLTPKEFRRRYGA